ncbi:ceramide glucosyltransferase-like [Argopecten irradians]|uniref:ceramide glucosyltransferase-like n=1 Tax=Argopecten irradians TaxID=31199 RepID=UPI00371F86A6
METVDYTLLGLTTFIFAAWCFNWSLHIASLIYGKWKFNRKLSSAVPLEELPGVSIIKPLLGVDPHLFENLESYFNIKYPQYELLFCIQDEMDAAIMIVQSLLKKYPNIDAKVFVGGKPVGINPKINNMISGYKAAKYDLVLVSDSAIYMGEDALLDMVLTMTENTGLVHQMPYACTRKGFASHMEKIFFGTQHAKMYLVANLLGINCATGMSSLMRKEVIEEAGGLTHYSQYLAEDFFLAETFLKKGWKIRISHQTARQNSGTYSMPYLYTRLTRWAKLRTAMVPSLIFWEPVSQCLVLGVINALSMSYLFNWTASVIFLVHCLLWFLLDYILIKVLERGPLPFSKFEFLVGWIINELTYLCVIIRSHWDSTIVWRTKRFRLRWGGVVEELHTKQTV